MLRDHTDDDKDRSDMKNIRVVKISAGEYELSIEENVYLLDEGDMKIMLAKVLEAYAGKPKPMAGSARHLKRKDFFKRLVTANDAGIQSILRAADHEDVLILLKINEGNDVFRGKFFLNMSPTQQKVFREDLTFKYKESPPQSKIDPAIRRLSQVCAKLEDEGLLAFGQ